jgi:hypothetical protein
MEPYQQFYQQSLPGLKGLPDSSIVQQEADSLEFVGRQGQQSSWEELVLSPLKTLLDDLLMHGLVG